MQLSELQGKEVVNLHDGARLGIIEETELVIDPEDGSLEALVLPGRGGMLSLFREEEDLAIPWENIVKIGSEIIIVDLALNGQEK